LLPAGVAAQTYTYTTIDVPGATSSLAYGINDLTHIVGSFRDSAGVHGFLRKNRGITVIDFPGASSTVARAINNRGQIVGEYRQNDHQYGFLLDGGHFTTIDPPGAISSVANSINDLGQIAGQFSPGTNASRGFVWTHGQYLPVDGSPVAGSRSRLTGINRHGQLIGEFADPNTSQLGFRMEADGRRTTINFPNAPANFDNTPLAINDRGEIVGQEVGIVFDGYVLAFGAFSKFHLPGSSDTIPEGLNNRGQIVGVYARVPIDTASHAFIATPIGVEEDISGSPSESGTRVPQAAVIADAELKLWTLGPGQEILRDGAQVANGYGSQILWYQGAIYVLGDDNQWWRWTGSTWEFFGATAPTP